MARPQRIKILVIKDEIFPQHRKYSPSPFLSIELFKGNEEERAEGESQMLWCSQETRLWRSLLASKDSSWREDRCPPEQAVGVPLIMPVLFLFHCDGGPKYLLRAYFFSSKGESELSCERNKTRSLKKCSYNCKVSRLKQQKGDCN